jgi:hypothetical protein
VSALWLEVRLGRTGLERAEQSVRSTTRDNGWFALCSLPSSGTVSLLAARNSDTTALIDLDVSPLSLSRQDLYVGSARTALVRDSTAEGDSVVAASRRYRSGDFVVRGRVLTTVGGNPIQGALVSVAEGPPAVANERGEWVLTSAPGGTQLLTVRAVGYYPLTQPVNVTTAVRPVSLSLSTLKYVLDTLKITTTALRKQDRSGFQERQQSGQGQYLNPDQIERLHAVLTSDLFQSIPSLGVSKSGYVNDKRILMRRGAMGVCEPAVFLDGVRMPEMTTGDIDAWARPNDLGGIEVYTGATTPPQYQTLNGCGSILLWTK